MASKALVLVCILAVVFVIFYAEESASEKTTTVHSNEAEKSGELYILHMHMLYSSVPF